MLAGMAIENLLKGAIVQAGGAPPKTHDLVALSQEARRFWNAAQLDLLTRLTTFIVWAGRYPVGFSEKETQQSRALKSTDHRTFVEIARRLFDVHNGGIDI